jgi:hypothetical protein
MIHADRLLLRLVKLFEAIIAQRPFSVKLGAQNGSIPFSSGAGCDKMGV